MAFSQFPRRFALGVACIAVVALSVSIDFLLSFLFGLPLHSREVYAAIVAVGWAGIVLLAQAISIGSRRARRHALLVDMNLAINRAILLNEEIDLIYGTILDYVFMIFPHVNYGSVLVLGEDGYLTFASSRGFTEEYCRGFRLKLEDSFIYQETGGQISRARLISDKTINGLFVQFRPDDWQFRSVISAPMFLNGRLFGLLNLDSNKPRTFSADDVHIVEQLTAQIEVGLFARDVYSQRIEESRVDSLTGLLTRRYFEELLAREIGRSARYGDEFVFALYDADGLKGVNDSLGHRAGDHMLEEIARTLSEGLRKTDILGRIGGDEFAGVYLRWDRPALAALLDDKRRRLASSATPFEGTTVPTSFSYGLALFPHDGTTLGELMEAADRELYEMKKGRGLRPSPGGKTPAGDSPAGDSPAGDPSGGSQKNL